MTTFHFDASHSGTVRHRLSAPRTASAGFTLLEIMVVVVILGILAALVAPNVIRRIDDANVTKAKQDIRAFETALNLYRMDNFRYPTTEQGLEALVEAARRIRTSATGNRAATCGSLQQGSLGQRLCLHLARHARRRLRSLHARCRQTAGRRRSRCRHRKLEYRAMTPRTRWVRSAVSPSRLYAARGPGRTRDHRDHRRDGGGLDQRARRRSPDGRGGRSACRRSSRRRAKRSMLDGRDVGMRVDRQGYDFLRYNGRVAAWEPVVDDTLLRERELPEGLNAALRLEARRGRAQAAHCANRGRAGLSHRSWCSRRATSSPSSCYCIATAPMRSAASPARSRALSKSTTTRRGAHEASTRHRNPFRPPSDASGARAGSRSSRCSPRSSSSGSECWA